MNDSGTPGPAPGDPPLEVVEIVDPVEDVAGWLVIDTLADGLAFGGFRFTPTVTRSEVERLARCMTWKLAGHGLPVGGAKAGLRCDPTGEGLARKLRVFAEHTGEALRGRVMVGKDMGASDAILDALYHAVGVPQLGLVQRRAPGAAVPDRLRDLTGYRRHMTGLGVAWAAEAALGGAVQGARVAIQGFGLVGAGAAVRLRDLGAVVVAVSDAAGAVAHADGLDVAELLAATEGRKTVDRAALRGRFEARGRDSLFDIDADVLVLAAASHSVDAPLAAQIAAPLVVEGSNFGLTDEARTELHRRGRVVIPDLIASSSSAAMVARQMAARNTLGEAALWRDIRAAIAQETRESLAAALRSGADVRTAYLGRLADAR